jgi:DNA-binding LacI/PurR family transcriptional regulator
VEGATSEGTAARVRGCAAELGYIVNGVAASMRNRQTRTVGVVIADVSNPWFGQLVGGVESVLGPAGFSVILANTSNSVEREQEALQALLQQQVDALIVASSSPDGAHLQRALARGTRMVLVDAALPGLDVDTVTIDNVAAARMAVDHLLDFGHRQVAIVWGGPGPASDQARLEGYREALRGRGLPVKQDHLVVGSSTFDGGKGATADLLRRDPRPTAIFVTNNLMTVGALVAIAEAGLRVPADVSIVGIDDMEWYPIADPAITAVDESATLIGRRAAERLLLRLRRERQPRTEHICVAAELRIRRSAGPPPADQPGGGAVG